MSDLTVNEEKSLSEETSGATDRPGASTLAISGEVVEDEVVQLTIVVDRGELLRVRLPKELPVSKACHKLNF